MATKIIKITKIFSNGIRKIQNDLITIEQPILIRVENFDNLEISRSGHFEDAENIAAEYIQPSTTKGSKILNPDKNSDCNTIDFDLTCTPSDIKALVVGFVFSKKIINSIKDIAKYSINKKRCLINIKTKSRSEPLINKSLKKIAAKNIIKVIETLKTKQKIFPKTGGTHAAALFDHNGKIAYFAEDIARHNAIDKVIGKALLAKKSTRGLGLALSSRVSLELAAKAARAGIEIIASVSAPTSLAIETAKKWNITLCSFVRDQRMNVYTNINRISDHK